MGKRLNGTLWIRRRLKQTGLGRASKNDRTRSQGKDRLAKERIRGNKQLIAERVRKLDKNVETVDRWRRPEDKTWWRDKNKGRREVEKGEGRRAENNSQTARDEWLGE